MATLDNLVNIISKLKGDVAQRFASHAANVITRLLGGDQSLHTEIDRNHALQQRLATENPDCAAAQFGQFVRQTLLRHRRVEVAATSSRLDRHEIIVTSLRCGRRDIIALRLPRHRCDIVALRSS